MAKRSGNGVSKSGAGRPSSTRRRSASGGLGPTLAGLAFIVAVLAGGTYVFRHTPAAPGSTVISTHSLPTPEPRPEHRSATSPSVPSIPGSSLPGQAQAHPPAAPLPSALTPGAAPFGTSEEVFESGARLYAANCAGCHGRPGRNARGPSATQFWNLKDQLAAHAVAQPVGTLYQATAMGNLAQGMPSYGQRLTDTQLWDLALLLKSAHEDLPEPVMRLLRRDPQ